MTKFRNFSIRFLIYLLTPPPNLLWTPQELIPSYVPGSDSNKNKFNFSSYILFCIFQNFDCLKLLMINRVFINILF